MDFIIIILLIVLIFQNYNRVIKKETIEKEKTVEEKVEEEKQLQRKKEFEKLMDYSIDDAIESKR